MNIIVIVLSIHLVAMTVVSATACTAMNVAMPEFRANPTLKGFASASYSQVSYWFCVCFLKT